MPKTSTSSVGLDPIAFGADVATVIALRSARIAAGGRAGQREARLMVTEKIAALAQVQWGLLTGAYGFTPESVANGVRGHYARAVRSNRKRLISSGK